MDETGQRIELLRLLVAEAPGDDAAHFLLGRALLDAGRPGEAIEAFMGALRANPDYAAAWRQLGNAQEAAGLPDEAIATYERGIAVAQRTNDLQAGKEMTAFLKRMRRSRSGGERP